MNEFLVIFWVGILPCLIVGIWQTFVGYKVLNRAKKSQTWQVAQGILIAQEEQTTANEVNFHLDTPLQVVYKVEGQEYYCRKVTLYENLKQRAQAIAQIQQLASVPVYYNPLNHKEAVIYKGVKPAYWLPVVLGVSSLLVAVAGFYFLVISA